MKSIADLGDLSGKRVVIRCDFNVPLDGQTITDDGRIKAALPTLKKLHEAGARTTVMAHLAVRRVRLTPSSRWPRLLSVSANCSVLTLSSLQTLLASPLTN